MSLFRNNRFTNNVNKYNLIIYVCVILACLVPRYTSSLKIHLGINISYYTVFVLLTAIVLIRRIATRRKIEFYIFIIWFLFIVLSVWRAEKIGVWGYYLDWILTALLFQQLLIQFKDDRTYDYIVRALTDALFLHLLIGIYEITSHRYLFDVGNVSRRLYGHVAIGIFYNLNDYATFVATMLPFAVLRLFISKRTLGRAYCSFLVVTSIYLIIISESRGAILAIAALILAAAFLFIRNDARSVVVLLGCVTILLVLTIFDLGGLQAKLATFANSNSIDVSSGSDAARINLIKNGIYFLGQTYGFGVGAGNLYDWLAYRSVYYIGELRFIHNWYVEVLVTFGVLFFALYMIFHIKLMYKLFSIKTANSKIKTTFALSFLCFSIVSVSSSSNVYSEWVWMYLVVVSTFVLTLDYQMVRVSLRSSLRKSRNNRQSLQEFQHRSVYTH